jgi:5'-nucleotidase
LLLNRFDAMKLSASILAAMLVSIVVGKPVQAEIIRFTLLQLNDVYEITPVSSGKSGGLARIATLREQLIAENPNTFTLIAGDMLSPSALGTAKIDGEAIAGAQMVAVMNAMGLDFATFGNHEFDLKEHQFYQRLAESQFRWFSGNVLDEQGQAFPGVPSSLILSIRGEEDMITVGLVGATLGSNPKDYVSYSDPFLTIKQDIDGIKEQTDVDVIVALTHLALEDDEKLAVTIPEIDLILGGHEHENVQAWRGDDFTPIFKADANGRTVYIHRLSYDTDTDHLEIQSQLKPIDGNLSEQPAVADIVNNWVNTSFEAFRSNGFMPEEVVATITEPLDGLESSVRNQPTALTEAIAAGMLASTPDAEVAIFNGGMIRIDDVLPPGELTQYDIIRIMPFGGKIMTVTMKGSLLEQVLNQGLANAGNGGYLQTANVTPTDGGWLIGDRLLELDETYMIAINDFLLTGLEQNLDYLTPDHPDVAVIHTGDDIRFSLINYLAP